MTHDLAQQTPAQRLAEAEGQAAAARAEMEREQTARAAREQAAQAAYDLAMITGHRALDATLESEGKAAFESFDKAVHDRDLSGAFAAWITERATREARRVIRNEAANAEMRQETGKSILPELRYYDANLLSRLQDTADRAATDLGSDMADALLEAMPQPQE